MTSLTELFKSPQDAPQDQDKLVDLFRNRAELKKEFAALRNEKYQLQDRIKQHQGATARVQQKLDHLENLLLDPEWMHNIVAFYQLRRLSMHCFNKLERFAEYLKQQREERVYSKAMRAFEQRKESKSGELKKSLAEARMLKQVSEDELQAQRHKLMTMNGFVRLFRGRGLSARIDTLNEAILGAQQQESELLFAIEEVGRLAPPDHEGLDCATKRNINFMILALAQHLYLHFEDNELAVLAKEASEKSAGAINYGGKRTCDEILHWLQSRTGALGSVKDLADVLQERAKHIAEHAVFRNDDDAVPVPASVATIYLTNARGVTRQKDANILGDNYFGVAKVLSR